MQLGFPEAQTIYATTSTYKQERRFKVSRTNDNQEQTPRKRPPAKTPDGRTKRLQSLAYDLVEDRLAKGTATSQETTTVLKIDLEEQRLKRLRLEHEVKLLEARTAEIHDKQELGTLMREAIDVFTSYRPTQGEEDEVDDPYIF